MIYRSSTITGGAQFLGLTEANGLFIPKNDNGSEFLGGANRQVRFNRMRLESLLSDPVTAMTSWAISHKTPDGLWTSEFISDTTLGFSFGSLGLETTEEDSKGNRMALVSLGMLGSARFMVDYDIISTSS